VAKQRKCVNAFTFNKKILIKKNYYVIEIKKS